MIFTLEALNANEGDSLLLHYGSADDPKLIVIDGGPRGIYKKSLLPRLTELRDSRAPDGQLPIRLMMVSHIDADHVAGVVDLVSDMVTAAEDDESMFDVTTLWHNSFGDVTKKMSVAALGVPDFEALTARADVKKKLKPASVAEPASIAQGRDLRNAAKQLGLNVNAGFDGGLVLVPASGKKTVKLGDGLSFKLIGPLQDQLQALQVKWAKEIAKLKKAGKLKSAETPAFAAEFIDKSVENLSSIVVLAELDGMTMLLTGDARGDFILEGLRSAGILKKKPLHVDIFKLPHHGSINNAAEELFSQITADHYVISADGKHDNPDTPTLELLVNSRGNDKYTIHLTNSVPSAVKFLKKAQVGKKFKVVFRDKSELSVKVELGDALGD